MTRKSLLITALAITFIALFQAQAMAWNFGSGGFGWGTYEAWYDIRGGQKPGTETTYVASYLVVEDAALVCVNPGNNKQDVRVGKGGITLVVYSDQSEFTQYDERGRYTLTQEINSSIVEFAAELYDEENGTSGCDPDQPLADLIANCPKAVKAFNAFYGVDETDCRNANWTPYQYLIKSLGLEGQIGTDCYFNSGNLVCEIEDNLCLYCSTNERYREWAEDGEVLYECMEVDCPY